MYDGVRGEQRSASPPKLNKKKKSNEIFYVQVKLMALRFPAPQQPPA